MVSHVIRASYLVFFVCVFSVVNCNLFRKCCGSDEGLTKILLNTTKNESKYECTSKFKDYVLPLRLNDLNIIEYGLPKQCGIKSCIDKMVNGQEVTELSCETEETNSTIELPTIFKCCPWNMFYNAITKSCVKHDNFSDEYSIDDLSAPVYNLVFGAPKCPNTYALVDYSYEDDFSISNGTLIINNSTIFNNGTYCINRSQKEGEIYVQTCEYKMDVCRNMSCVPKCCPAGQKKFKPSPSVKAECVDNFTTPFFSNFIDSNNTEIGIPEQMAILSPLKCQQYMEQEFRLFKNGSLNFKDMIFHATDQTFCIEYLDAPIIKKYVALICFPPVKVALHNFWYLAGLLVSIVFLAITLTIYFFLPELQNLHGRTLMSHSTSLLASYIFLAMVKKPLTSYAYATCLILEKMAILAPLNCEQYVERNFTLYKNGSLNFKRFHFDATDQTFCIDYFDAPCINIKQYVALICAPTIKVSFRDFYFLAGLLVSIVFLVLTFAIYCFLPDLRNLHGRTVMSYTASLLASYIFLAMVKKPITSYGRVTCFGLAYGIMYTFLVAFAWLNVMCFDIWYTFGVVKARGMKKNKDLKRFLLYCLYAYGLPLIITGITLYVHLFSDVPKQFKPTFAQFSCWFDLRVGGNHWPYTIFFGIPVAIIIFFNMVLFTLTVKHCLKVRHDIQKMQHADSPKKRRFFTDKATLIMNLKLFIVMGISWIFEVMAMYVREPYWLWYILDTINVLQGLWIFFIFVLKDNVWKALKKKLGYQVLREGSQTQSTALTAKNSVASTTSLRINGIRPEEKDLLQNAIRNSAGFANGRQ